MIRTNQLTCLCSVLDCGVGLEPRPSWWASLSPQLYTEPLYNVLCYRPAYRLNHAPLGKNNSVIPCCWYSHTYKLTECLNNRRYLWKHTCNELHNNY